jgi:hypothetical protein
VVDVLDRDRPLLGRDLAREPAPERDARPDLDLLLEAARRAGDELVGLLVEQQEGDGVALERLADPEQELGEQVVEVEVRERRVRDRLDAPEVVVVMWFAVDRAVLRIRAAA